MRADDHDQVPLFGETRRTNKIINYVVALVTALFVLVTIILAFMSCLILTGKFAIYPLDLVFCFIILLQLVPQLFVATWYRRGELEPKFRRMIYYNAILTILLCITANLYFFEVGVSPSKCMQLSNHTTKAATSLAAVHHNLTKHR